MYNVTEKLKYLFTLIIFIQIGDTMSFKHTGSHATDKLSILKHVPSYDEIIKMIKDGKPNSEELALMGLLILTGARISECLRVRLKDIRYKNEFDQDIMPDYENFYIPPATAGAPVAVITLDNLKAHGDRKKDNFKFKYITVIATEKFIDPYDWIRLRANEVGKQKNPDAKLITFSRTVAWWRIKKIMGNDAYPHLFRHWCATNDLRLGLHSEAVRKKLGHRSFSALNTYSNLNFDDVSKQLKAVYGPAINQAIKPLSSTKVLGMYTAAQQVGMKQTADSVKKEEVIMDGNGKLDVIYAGYKPRTIARQILKTMPDVKEYNNQLREKAILLAKEKKAAIKRSAEDERIASISNDLLPVV